MARSEHSIIKGMQREHDRLIELGRQIEAEVARLEAQNEAMAAALREHGCDFMYPSPVRQPAPCLEHWGNNSAEAKERWCSTCAALSPNAGADWVKVREQARERLRRASTSWHNQLRHQDDYASCRASECEEDRAALDALKEGE